LPVSKNVRLLGRPYIFRKGAKQKAFSDKVFQVTRVSPYDPNAYYIKDDDDEEIQGKLYRRQLQSLTRRPDKWEVRIHGRRKSRVKGRKGQKEVLVEWVGFPNTPRQWILEADLHANL
jgi:hypothetical protein